MVRICIRMLRILFKPFEFAFEWFESLISGSNLDSNALNPFRMVSICIRMLRIPFELFEFAFVCFESLSNGSNFDSNAFQMYSNDSNPFRVVRISIRIVQIVGICIRMFQINFQNLHSNALKGIRSIRMWLEFVFEMLRIPLQFRICIRILEIPFKWVIFGFECFESLSSGSNLDLKASNPFCRERFEFAFECFESNSSGSNLDSNAFECYFERDSEYSNPNSNHLKGNSSIWM